LDQARQFHFLLRPAAHIGYRRARLDRPADWFWGLHRWLRLLGETVLIAYVGTLSGTMIAFAACFVASRNLVRSALICMAVRRVLELLRTVPDIVFAMVFVVAFGLGPPPGVLTLHSAGTLGKLFTETVESIDLNPVEGVTAVGGGLLSRVRFGALPQVPSNIASYTLLRLEINVRGATVIGFVGAGGIGEDLLIAIRKFYYQDVSAMLLLIVACVMLLDMAPNRCAIACWLWSTGERIAGRFPRPCRRRGAAAAYARHDGAAARRAGLRHLSGPARRDARPNPGPHWAARRHRSAYAATDVR
jgi:phosphonate ABC transporter permease subunit PhnE